MECWGAEGRGSEEVESRAIHRIPCKRAVNMSEKDIVSRSMHHSMVVEGVSVPRGKWCMNILY